MIACDRRQLAGGDSRQSRSGEIQRWRTASSTWVLGFTLVYSMLFGVGDVLFGRLGVGLGLMGFSVACFGLLFWSLNRRGWSVWL